MPLELLFFTRQAHLLGKFMSHVCIGSVPSQVSDRAESRRQLSVGHTSDLEHVV